MFFEMPSGRRVVGWNVNEASLHTSALDSAHPVQGSRHSPGHIPAGTFASWSGSSALKSMSAGDFSLIIFHF